MVRGRSALQTRGEFRCTCVGHVRAGAGAALCFVRVCLLVFLSPCIGFFASSFCATCFVTEQTQQIAQKTDANQLCRTLLVSDKARVTVMPSMEIIANDVKCTHGATICDLEDEELFYLMSRGISKIEVSHLRPATALG